MQYGFVIQNDGEYNFVGNMSLSVGDGLELDSRYGWDASKRPQSLVRRKRNTAKTASVNIAINRTASVDLFAEIQKYEALSGSVGEFYWAGTDEGLWCVKDISFSLATDGIDIISSVQISINIAEGFVAKKKAATKTTVNLL